MSSVIASNGTMVLHLIAHFVKTERNYFVCFCIVGNKLSMDGSRAGTFYKICWRALWFHVACCFKKERSVAWWLLDHLFLSLACWTVWDTFSTRAKYYRRHIYARPYNWQSKCYQCLVWKLGLRTHNTSQRGYA